MLARLPEKLRQSLAAYMDAHYVGAKRFAVPAAAKRTACAAASRGEEEVCGQFLEKAGGRRLPKQKEIILRGEMSGFVAFCLQILAAAHII